MKLTKPPMVKAPPRSAGRDRPGRRRAARAAERVVPAALAGPPIAHPSLLAAFASQVAASPSSASSSAGPMPADPDARHALARARLQRWEHRSDVRRRAPGGGALPLLARKEDGEPWRMPTPSGPARLTTQPFVLKRTPEERDPRTYTTEEDHPGTDNPAASYAGMLRALDARALGRLASSFKRGTDMHHAPPADLEAQQARNLAQLYSVGMDSEGRRHRPSAKAFRQAFRDAAAAGHTGAPLVSFLEARVPVIKKGGAGYYEAVLHGSGRDGAEPKAKRSKKHRPVDGRMTSGEVDTVLYASDSSDEEMPDAYGRQSRLKSLAADAQHYIHRSERTSTASAPSAGAASVSSSSAGRLAWPAQQRPERGHGDRKRKRSPERSASAVRAAAPVSVPRSSGAAPTTAGRSTRASLRLSGS